MEARVKWTDNVSFIGETGTGHKMVIDGAPEYGGRNLGPRPMELLLLGTAACTASDVVLILRKARQTIRGCMVEARAERAENDPKVFARVDFTYKVIGRALDASQVKRAVELSQTKYCSASAMVAKTAIIDYVIELEDEAPNS